MATTISGTVGGVIGDQQTWQDVTSSRSSNVTYTNTTGKPIMVIITIVDGAASWAMNISVGGIASWEVARGSSGHSTVSFIVPNGVSYLAYSNWGTFLKWAELR